MPSVYTILDDFVEGLYLSGDNKEARKLVAKISAEYDKRFKILSDLSEENQEYLIDRIKEEMDNYKRLLLFVSIYENQDYIKKIEEQLYKAISGLNDVESLLLEN